MVTPPLPMTLQPALREPASPAAPPRGMEPAPLVSVVLPCLNEEEGIGPCLETIQRTFATAKIAGEIVVCDNGSTDRSVAIAERLGARVVHQPLRGYGNAYLTGFAAARGTYLIMGDADDTYDFTLIPQFLTLLIHEGYDFVTGSRYLGGGDTHITALHRFVGNPALTALLNGLFGTAYTDVYCGFRGFSRQAYTCITPVSPGMEFNLELAINAGLAKLKTIEVPITLRPRQGKSKLRTLRDGWRSVRMMMLYCPNKLFLWPGALLCTVGLLTHAAVLLGVLQWGRRPAAAVTGIFALMFSVLGVEILSLGLHAKTYSWSRRFDKHNAALEWFYSHFKLEHGLALGAGLLTLGGCIMGRALLQWVRAGMLPLPHPAWTSFAATLLITGCHVCFSSLFISMMSIAPSTVGVGGERRSHAAL
jgi:glycosyltransferase involved in cell wall biosynthesis